MPHALVRITVKAYSSLRHRGLWRTLWAALLKLWYERKLGVDTDQYVPIEQLDVDDEARSHAHAYGPASHALLHEAFKGGFVDVRDQVFVDYGCGMGRVLLFAAMLPFRKIVGVEISESLSAQAKANLERYYAVQIKRTPEWQVVTCDAREFALPDDASLFFFNLRSTQPFSPT